MANKVAHMAHSETCVLWESESRDKWTGNSSVPNCMTGREKDVSHALGSRY